MDYIFDNSGICRVQVQRGSGGGKKSGPLGGGSGSGPAAGAVSIHPQAAPVVCRHVLDTLISLAKLFPTHFLPSPGGKGDSADKDKVCLRGFLKVYIIQI